MEEVELFDRIGSVRPKTSKIQIMEEVELFDRIMEEVELFFLTESWKKLSYLTEFALEPPVPGSRSLTDWPEAWSDWRRA